MSAIHPGASLVFVVSRVTQVQSGRGPCSPQRYCSALGTLPSLLLVLFCEGWAGGGKGGLGATKFNSRVDEVCCLEQKVTYSGG